MALVDDPQECLRRANEARAVADFMTDIARRDQLLWVAQEFDKLAARAIESLKTNAISKARKRLELRGVRPP